MVCLAASVLTKGGKVLLARQFVEMPRMRIENLLATFPKLVGADKQHNTVETQEVRYVYQPIEGLMVLLMTNKLSNLREVMAHPLAALPHRASHQMSSSRDCQARSIDGPDSGGSGTASG